jgi:hypothetical protein
MRNDASSARSTRQQLRPGTNNEDCAAEDREAGPGDCCRNSDCFCNFLATFILGSGEKCKSSALAGVKNVTDTSFRETVCRVDGGWGPGVLCQTFCPHSSTDSGHRPTHTVMCSRRSNRSVSCTAFSTVVMFYTLGLTLGPACGVESVHVRFNPSFCLSIEFGGTNRHHVPGKDLNVTIETAASSSATVTAARVGTGHAASTEK